MTEVVHRHTIPPYAMRRVIVELPFAGDVEANLAYAARLPEPCASRQEGLKRDPHIGDLYVFRGRRGDLIKIIWHDGQGACLFTKRLERGRFLWPSLADGVVTISVAQLSYLLSGIDWRMPQATWRPQASG